MSAATNGYHVTNMRGIVNSWSPFYHPYKPQSYGEWIMDTGERKSIDTSDWPTLPRFGPMLHEKFERYEGSGATSEWWSTASDATVGRQDWFPKGDTYSTNPDARYRKSPTDKKTSGCTSRSSL